MSNIMPFCFKGNDVRAICLENKEPLFVAKDICDVLGYKDSINAIKQHCKGVVKLHPLQTAGGTQKVRVIDEPELYRLVIGSKLPAAEKFERWVFEEVLPTIRKTGSYTTDQLQQLNHWHKDIVEVASLADGIIAEAEIGEQEKWELVDRLFCKLFGQGVEIIGRNKVEWQSAWGRALICFSTGSKYRNGLKINSSHIITFEKQHCKKGDKLACRCETLYQHFCIYWNELVSGAMEPPPIAVFMNSVGYTVLQFIGEPWFIGVAPQQELVKELE